MTTVIDIGQYYKVENKMTAILGYDSKETRVFEKKDYAFKVISFGKNDRGGSVVTVEYQGELYTFDRPHAEKNFRKALTYKDIVPYMVLKYITGSNAYGTNVPTSDTDYKGVFILPDEMYGRLDFNPDWEEIKEKNHLTNEESTYYSLRKFFQLLAENNPNMLEVFDIPDDCLVYKHSCMDEILKSQGVFLSKLSYKAFLGYGESQIRKADGQDKMSNWEKSEMKRKSPLDFCFTFNGQGSVPIEEWLSDRGMEQRFCALNSINHMHDMYGLYYDELAHLIVYLKEIINLERDVTDIQKNPICRKKLAELNRGSFTMDFLEDAQRTLDFVKSKGEHMLGYKGIVLEDSNEIRLSVTPKDADPICYMSYNKDGYTTHCKLYNRYETWKRERNDARWTDVEGHNQKIDGKNMLHCMRLIYMSEDIAAGRGIIVRRPEAEYLKSIRYGKVNLETLIQDAADKLKTLEHEFAKADLPTEPDTKIVLEIYDRTKSKMFYNE